MSDRPEQTICDAIGILVRAGILDYNGHASQRISDDQFLINTGASNRAAMSPDQLCRVDMQGRAQGGTRPPNEVHLHAAIYCARPDVQAVVHGHPKWTTLFTLTGTPIPVVMPQACLIAQLPVYDQSHSISTAERATAMTARMAQRPGVLLAGHGSVFAGSTLQEAAALAIYAEQNAERAYRAAALGRPNAIPERDWPAYQETLNKPGLFQKCWDFHLTERT